MDIAVIGLGKLGAPLAAVLASRGHRVWGVDVDPARVDAINSGRAPVPEPDLQQHIDAAGPRLRALGDIAAAVRRSDVGFVIVPTPTVEGMFTNRHVVEAVRQIGRALRGDDRYYVVNVTSTVMPRSMGGEIRAALEQASGRRVGETVGLTYNPEFIALGSVVRDLLHPDLLLIGQSDRRAGDVIEMVHRAILRPLPPIHRMNWVNAEIAKLAVNTFVTTKISYANMLAEICERLPGADVDAVTAAVGDDRRIGSRYLRGGLGYGGPCFPRDNGAFAHLARSLDASGDLAAATDAINQRQVERIIAWVRRLGERGSAVAVLGLAYKPGTPVVEESQGIMIARGLAQAGFSVTATDPLALDAAAAVLDRSIVLAATPEAAIAVSDIVVIATPDAKFAALPPSVFATGGRGRIVLDCWRLLPAQLCDLAEVLHVRIGTGEPTPARQRRDPATPN